MTSGFLQLESTIDTYILLKISNEHHRSFHFCRAVLSTHSFFKSYFEAYLLHLKLFIQITE
jgi:hypothetical protein